MCLKGVKKRIRHLKEDTFRQDVNTRKTHPKREYAWHMAKGVQYVKSQTILRRYAEVRADRPPIDDKIWKAVDSMCQNNEDAKVAIQEHDSLRSQKNRDVQI